MSDSYWIPLWVRLGRNNRFICRAVDPTFDEKRFVRCDTVEELESKLRQGNWCLGEAFYYKDICFIQQESGGDEWLVIKQGLPFESITVGAMKENRFQQFVESVISASLEDCMNLKYEPSIMRKYVCNTCGHEKLVMVNHHVPEIWERCTPTCMWSSDGEQGPVLMSADGHKTGFRKRRFRLVEDNK